MHKFEGEYGENDCNVKLKGGEPYFLINLEKYCYSNNFGGSSPHCDFIYVIFDGDKIKIFIVELKNINDIQRERIEGILNEAYDKFLNTKFLLYNENRKDIVNIVNFFNIRNAEHYGVLVLPESDKINALLSRFKSKFVSLKRNGFSGAWISPCGGSIWSRLI